jgi:hypothetical protein
MEKIVSTSLHRPGDVRIKSTTHGWKDAEGKKLLMEPTVCSAAPRITHLRCLYSVQPSAPLHAGNQRRMPAWRLPAVARRPATESVSGGRRHARGQRNVSDGHDARGVGNIRQRRSGGHQGSR